MLSGGVILRFAPLPPCLGAAAVTFGSQDVEPALRREIFEAQDHAVAR